MHENREKQLDLEKTVKTLKQELEETVKIRDKTIIELKEKIKNYEFSQKIISDLRTNLAEQKELLSQRYLEVQCITLEKDKFSALSLYKDSLLNDLRNQIKLVESSYYHYINFYNYITIKFLFYYLYLLGNYKIVSLINYVI